jgi:hypothetical protein
MADTRAISSSLKWILFFWQTIYYYKSNNWPNLVKYCTQNHKIRILEKSITKKLKFLCAQTTHSIFTNRFRKISLELQLQINSKSLEINQISLENPEKYFSKKLLLEKNLAKIIVLGFWWFLLNWMEFYTIVDYVVEMISFLLSIDVFVFFVWISKWEKCETF